MKTATMRIRLVLVSMLLAGYCQAAINPKTLVGMWLFDEGTGKQQKMPSVPVTKVKSRDQNGPKGSSERLCHLKLTTQLLAILTAMRKISLSWFGSKLRRPLLGVISCVASTVTSF